MARLLILALLAVIVCKMITGRYPWEYLSQSSARSREIDRARKLLSVRTGASRKDILDAHRKRIAVVHPDRGGTNAQVHEANAARDLLLNETTDQ